MFRKRLVSLVERPGLVQNARMIMLETPRLLLRRWREEDVAPLAAVNADPEVMRWIGDGSVRDEQQTRSGIEAMEHEWEAQGFGLFAVEIRSTRELAGFTGLSIPDFLPEVLPAVEVGWRLGRAHWGQGLATEAAAAAVRSGSRTGGWSGSSALLRWATMLPNGSWSNWGCICSVRPSIPAAADEYASSGCPRTGTSQPLVDGGDENGGFVEDSQFSYRVATTGATSGGCCRTRPRGARGGRPGRMLKADRLGILASCGCGAGRRPSPAGHRASRGTPCPGRWSAASPWPHPDPPAEPVTAWRTPGAGAANLGASRGTGGSAPEGSASSSPAPGGVSSPDADGAYPATAPAVSRGVLEPSVEPVSRRRSTVRADGISRAIRAAARQRTVRRAKPWV